MLSAKWQPVCVGLNVLTHWGRDKMDAISQTIFSNAFSWMKMLQLLLKFHWRPKGLINDIPALVQIMAWRHAGDKPLSEPMMARLLTHICVTRPQWVKDLSDAIRVCLLQWRDIEGNAHWSINPKSNERSEKILLDFCIVLSDKKKNKSKSVQFKDTFKQLMKLFYYWNWSCWWPNQLRFWCGPLNSLKSGGAYVRQLSGTSLIRRMACHMFVAKPLP